uniref:ATP synthase subunit 8 n=1 Tax=Seriatopora sp. PG-2017 TaxID=1964317 RepID=A0A1S6Y0U5_9CNID|nr:ATP synthase subunit 8 [Seriatopora sp. PG-2017]
MPQLKVSFYKIQYWWGFSVLFLLLIFFEIVVFPLIKRNWWIRKFLMKCDGAILTKIWLQKEIYNKKKKLGGKIKMLKIQLNF